MVAELFVDGRVPLDRLPDLSGEPRATCQYCGARYIPQYRWVDQRGGGWRLVSADEAVRDHERFCRHATPEVRKVVGNNEGYPE